MSMTLRDLEKCVKDALEMGLNYDTPVECQDLTTAEVFVVDGEDIVERDPMDDGSYDRITLFINLVMEGDDIEEKKDDNES